ncbi:MAG: leucine-rich repeat protein [Clostridia bacterium]|nr:leucine-rich repeat protein [Clostridia bacterium]MBQ3563856.1 leucine-rich repeat protein [Clostridia bacterium]MBQ9957579.1 leucine-rich repeat protein [Clostridia bacterium]
MKKGLAVFTVLICFCFASCKDGANGSTISSETSSYQDIQSANEYDYEIVDDGIKIISHNDNQENSIIIPERIEGKSVKVLGGDTFYQHKNTVAISLPQSLTTIEGSPFYRCYSLQEITIPSGVTEISSNPFFRCSALTEIRVALGNTCYSAMDGVLFNADKTELIAYPEGKLSESYTVPKSVKKLNIDSFGYETKLKRLTIPSNVVEFPDGSMFVFPEKITLIVESGSVAEKYAIDNELKYEIKDLASVSK